MINLVCISRDYIRLGLVPGLKQCKGTDKIRDTHCVFCEFYTPDETMEEEVENPVIFKKDRAQWGVE